MRLAVTYTRFGGLDPPMDRELDLDGFPRLLRERIQRFRRPADRMARIAAYRLLHTALAGCGLGPAPLDGLRWDSNGRPFAAALRGADFNLSHSGGLAVCALAWGGRTGVDVERIRDISRAGFERYFPASEWRRVVSAANPRRAFFESWTRLESVAKGEGFGLAGPTGGIEFTESGARVNGRDWALFRIDAGPGYCCHAAAWPAPEEITVSGPPAGGSRGDGGGNFLEHAAREKEEGMPVYG